MKTWADLTQARREFLGLFPVQPEEKEKNIIKPKNLQARHACSTRPKFTQPPSLNLFFFFLHFDPQQTQSLETSSLVFILSPHVEIPSLSLNHHLHPPSTMILTSTAMLTSTLHHLPSSVLPLG